MAGHDVEVTLSIATVETSTEAEPLVMVSVHVPPDSTIPRTMPPASTASRSSTQP